MPLRKSPVPPSVPWFAATAGLEAVGDSVARSLLPIVAVSTLGAGAAAVGVINSLGLAAFLLLSLPIGVLADRWSAPRRMTTVSTLVRAGLAGAAVLAWLLGWLHGSLGLGLMVGLAATVGIADVVYTAGQGLLIPRLVAPDQIRPVFGRVQTASQAGGAAGTALLAGLLVLVAAPFAWAAALLFYVGSALTQTRVREIVPGPASPPRVAMWTQARAGAGQLFAHPDLARITLANAGNNAAVMAANTLLPVIALKDLGLAPGLYAGLGVCGALAGIAGAGVASPLTTRVGLRGTRILTATAMVFGVLLVMLSGTVADILPGPAALWLAVQFVLAGAGTSIAMVAGADLPARLIPGSDLGTVMGAQRALTLGIMPLAAVVFGVLGTVLGLEVALWIWLGVAVLAAIPCFRLQHEERAR